MARGGAQRIPRPATWSPGGPADWTGRDLTALTSFGALNDALHERIAPRAPGEHQPPYVPQQMPRRSAVLIALHDSPDGPSVVLTRRTAHLSSHKGEMSFPGGRVDEGETLLQAAVREAQEEINLDPELVNPVGELDSLSTIVSQSAIHPIVATIGAFPQLRAHEAEVERIVHVPLLELASAETYRREVWMRDGLPFDIHFFEIEGDTVWGATGRMLHQLLDLLTAPQTA